MWTIGYIVGGSVTGNPNGRAERFFRAFKEELEAVGLVAGEDFIIRWISGGADRASMTAARTAFDQDPNVNLIVTMDSRALNDLHNAVDGPPIITALTDTLGFRALQSLSGDRDLVGPARPVTGVFYNRLWSEFARFRVLKYLLDENPDRPNSVAVLWNQALAGRGPRTDDSRPPNIWLDIPTDISMIEKAFGLTAQVGTITDREGVVMSPVNSASTAPDVGIQIEVALDQLALQVPEGASFVLVPDAVFNYYMRQIVDFANQRRWISVLPSRDWVDVGGLISCGVNPEVMVRQVGRLAAEVILSSSDPLEAQELPLPGPVVLAPDEVAINRTAADRLGVAISPDLLRYAGHIAEFDWTPPVPQTAAVHN